LHHNSQHHHHLVLLAIYHITLVFRGPKLIFTFTGLSGGVVQVDASCKSAELRNGVGMTIYHFVDSIDTVKERVEELGGKTMSGKEAEGSNGWYMYFLDVEGNRFGIYELRKESGGT